MKLAKVHAILKLKQSDWLKRSIDFNTGKRKNEANSCEEDFFKLMNDSVFGKTMGNLRKRINVKLVNDAKGYVIYTKQTKFSFTGNI